MAVETIHRPLSLGELGYRRNLIDDLALKTLYMRGEMGLNELGASLKVSMKIVEEVFQQFRKEELCEVKGLVDGIHRITTTSEGRSRAVQLLSQSQYVGAAPVSLSDYVARVRSQSVRDIALREADLERACQHIVIDRSILTQLGTALVSGTSIFLYGPTGTGKTTLAEAIPNAYQDRVWVPWALEVDGQVITIFDPILHYAVDDPATIDSDPRWVLCKRPRVSVGGELTIEMLDLQYNPATKFYSAPVHVRANNGVMIIDDFGRQRFRPAELFNRWTVPLDRRVDYLTLAGGRKFEIPFDAFVVFATNLDPSTLADEAFLRRIHNKVRVDYVSPEQFHEIFRRLCEQYGLPYERPLVDTLIAMLGKDWNQPLRACYPLDVISQIRWSAQYAGKEPVLNHEALTQACHNYFLAPGQKAHW
jgi:predicted ATPase with chaperone activity